MINHRGDTFSEMYDDCRRILADVFKTDNEIFVLSGSGTAAMEAAVGCVTGPSDRVVAIENGKFGERFKDLASRYGTAVPLEFEWGTSVDLDAVEKALQEGARAVTMVHNETSAGILNPAEEVGKLARKYGALFIMDGVTSIGGDVVKVDGWNVDIAVVGSQKCIGAPPGLSMISVSDRAFEAMEGHNLPYYLDLPAYRKSAAKDKTQTSYTPAIPLFYALQESLHIIEEEGLDARISRHCTGSAAVRAAMEALRVDMFPQLDEFSHYSNTVSAMKAPEGLDGNSIKKAMLKAGIVIAGGQAHLSGRIFRIGSMGNVTSGDIMRTIQQLEIILKKEGIVKQAGPATEAAAAVFDKE
jgi:aspartate aminotransferase-like enzyme